MVDFNIIESLLKIQGITTHAPEQEIRSLLENAGYHIDEINSAITTLQKSKIKENITHHDGLYKIYRANNHLNPAEITALLGIDIDVSYWQADNHRKQGVSTSYLYFIIGLTLLLALSGIIFVMYLNETGPFYDYTYAYK